MDRTSYKLPFGKSGATKFHCPSCEKGILKIKDKTFNYEETAASKEAHEHEAWDPEWIEYIFSGFFECTNSTCKDIVACIGTGSITENYSYDEDGYTEVEHIEFFTPKYFSPHLKLFPIAPNTPENIVNEINNSFSLIFSDPPSSANHIRIALENLLNHLSIKRFIIRGGKRTFLALHKRIDLLPSKYQNIKDIIFAIKWLGNAGSHSNHEVTFDDVLDSYELMEEILNEIFNNTRKKSLALAKKIIKRKGPKSI